MKYRAVHQGLFSDPTFLQADPDVRWIMTYLLIAPHGNMIGCFRLPKSYISEDTGYPIDRVSIGLRYCIDSGFIRYCDTTGWVWIRRYLKYNPVAGPKQASAANRMILDIPTTCCFFDEFRQLLDGVFQGIELPERYPIDTLSIPLFTRDPDPDPDPLESETDTNSENLPGAGESDRGLGKGGRSPPAEPAAQPPPSPPEGEKSGKSRRRTARDCAKTDGSARIPPPDRLADAWRSAAEEHCPNVDADRGFRLDLDALLRLRAGDQQRDGGAL